MWERGFTLKDGTFPSQEIQFPRWDGVFTREETGESKGKMRKLLLLNGPTVTESYYDTKG